MIGVTGIVLAYLAAGALGGILSISELVTRYRDDPKRAILTVPAVMYIIVNILASVGALYLIRIFGWTFGLSASGSPKVLVLQVLVAAFGSAALFRSSVLSIVVSDETVNVGPSAILTILTSAADRAVDRGRARLRSESVARIMDGVSFSRAAAALPVYCWGAMQNATSQEIAAVNTVINSLQADVNANVPDQIKSYVLGFVLLNVLGERVLSEVVHQLKDKMSMDPPPPPDQGRHA